MKAVGEVQEIRFLNRVLAWQPEGLTWEADPRHAEMVIKQLGVDSSRSAATPGTKEETKGMIADSKCPEEMKENQMEEDILAFVLGRGDDFPFNGGALTDDETNDMYICSYCDTQQCTISPVSTYDL